MTVDSYQVLYLSKQQLNKFETLLYTSINNSINDLWSQCSFIHNRLHNHCLCWMPNIAQLKASLQLEDAKSHTTIQKHHIMIGKHSRTITITIHTLAKSESRYPFTSFFWCYNCSQQFQNFQRCKLTNRQFHLNYLLGFNTIVKSNLLHWRYQTIIYYKMYQLYGRITNVMCWDSSSVP